MKFNALLRKIFRLSNLIILILILIIAKLLIDTPDEAPSVKTERELRIKSVIELAGMLNKADGEFFNLAVDKNIQKIPVTSYPNQLEPWSEAPTGNPSGEVRLWCGHPDVQWDGIANTLEDANIIWGTGYGQNDKHTYKEFTFKRIDEREFNYAYFEYTDAPKPTECRVVYAYSPGYPVCGSGAQILPVITTDTDGC